MSNRELARRLDTDGSLVGKWLKGQVLRVTHPHHPEKLAEILGTPPDYFKDDRSKEDLLEELVATVGDLLDRQVKTEKELARLRSQLRKREAQLAAAAIGPSSPQRSRR